MFFEYLFYILKVQVYRKSGVIKDTLKNYSRIRGLFISYNDIPNQAELKQNCLEAVDFFLMGTMRISLFLVFSALNVQSYFALRFKWVD